MGRVGSGGGASADRPTGISTCSSTCTSTSACTGTGTGGICTCPRAHPAAQDTLAAANARAAADAPAAADAVTRRQPIENGNAKEDQQGLATAAACGRVK